MAQVDEIDYSTVGDDEVALDDAAQTLIARKDDWLKFTKGQVMRAAFVNFATVDVNAVAAARAAAREESRTLTPDELRQVAQKALAAQAAKLGVSALSPIDRLDLTEAKFKMFRFHFAPSPVGYVLSKLDRNGRTKEGPESDKVWKSLEEPKDGFSTLLLVYPTDAKGNIDKNRLATDWRLIKWRLGKKTFEEILKINTGLRGNGLSIASQDVRLECKEPQYQQISATSLGPATWLKVPAFKQAVLTQALSMYDDLIPFKEMSTETLRSKLGMGGSTTSDVGMAAGGQADYGDLLARI